jgi:Flp pilus assembly protein TadD
LAAAPLDSRLLCANALALIRLERHSDAVAAAERAISADPMSEWAHRLHAIALVGAARVQKGSERKHSLQRAIAAAEETAKLAPHSHLSYIVMADAYRAASVLDSADAAAQRAIELAPNESDAWICRSQVALRARDFAAAEDAARTALSLAPDNFAAHNNLGAALLGRGKRKEAARAFMTAGQLQPTSATVHRNLFVAGMFRLRIVLALACIPLLLIPGVGPVVFFLALIGMNVFVRRSQRLRSWATARGARIGTAPARHDAPTSIAPAARADKLVALKPIVAHNRVRTWLLVIGDVVLGFITFCVVVAAISPPDDGSTSRSFLPVVIMFLLLDLLFAWITWKRVQAVRRARELESRWPKPQVTSR